MSSNFSREASEGPRGSGLSSTLTSVAHPLVEEPWPKSLALVMLVVACTIVATVSFEGAVYGAITALVLTASVSRYLLPTRFELNAAGITVTHIVWRRWRAWEEVRRVDLRSNGLFLSPFPRPTRLDSYRGLFLPARRTELEQLREYVTRHVRS